jgi:hypothetical protein
MGRSAKEIVTAPRALEWTKADEDHVRKIAKGPLGKALSVDQLRSLYATSLGLPDAKGTFPAYRERVQAAQMLTVNVLPRPKAEEPEGGEGGAMYELINPYGEHACPSCGFRFTDTSGPGEETIATTTKENESHG